MGLPADRPFVLYVCSSLFRGDPPEADFTITWIQAIRKSDDPRLQGLGILVRPHPGRKDEWAGHDIAALGVAFHGDNPIDDEARDDYFDALHYSAAVVGLNTSAFLEAGVAGKPVLAVLPKAYWKSQEGTLHFQYLLKAGGGLLRTSRSIDEHLPQLASAVSGEAPADNAGFVGAFIRPFGLDQPATPRFADAIEAVLAQPAPPPWKPASVGRLTSPLLRSRLGARRGLARWRRARKDARHDLRKTRERAARAVRKPLKQFSERGLALRWRAVVPKTDRRQAWSDAAANQEAVLEARQTVMALRASGRPIVAGPWLSETGFELLYWVPFLRWAQKYGNLRASRIVAVSRGGAALWYDEIAGQYVDVFDLFEVDEFRAANDRRIASQDGQKHYEVTAFDREILSRAAARLGLARYDLLHPGVMYNLFRPFWMQLAPIDLLRSFTIARRLRTTAADRLPGLPERYIAVKFYTNQALPEDAANRQFVLDVVRRLAERHHVVLLQTGLSLDDHGEFGAARSDRVHAIDRLMTPQNNLDVQTRAIAGADALVMTYGGFSYLGPLLGVKTLTFYSNPAGFRIDHLEVAQRTFRDIGGAPFVALRTDDVGRLESLLGSEREAVLP
jgi:hypothetical protein